MPSNDPDEIREMRKDTERLIETAGVPISLIRQPAAVPDGAGGYSRPGEPVTLPPKERYFSGVNFHFTGFEQNTSYGEVANLPYVLVGLWDDDIREGDTFIYNGQSMRVTYVLPMQDFETKAEVVYQGTREDVDA